MSDEIYAFPAANAHAVLQEGMTLRDWFAGQALPSLITGRDWSYMEDGPEKVDAWANAAYIVADALLAARKEPSE